MHGDGRHDGRNVSIAALILKLMERAEDWQTEVVYSSRACGKCFGLLFQGSLTGSQKHSHARDSSNKPVTNAKPTCEKMRAPAVVLEGWIIRFCIDKASITRMGFGASLVL